MKLPCSKFCVLPWVHSFVSAVGDVYPCCFLAREAGDDNTLSYKLGNLSQEKAKSVYNNNNISQLRRDILQNNPPPACYKYCLNSESAGGMSYRKWANSEYFNLIDENKINSSDKLPIKYWHVGFSNTCNFRCRSCNPSASCSIDKEFSKNVDKYPVLLDNNNGSINYNPENFINDKLLDQLKKNYKDIEVLQFHGGEPLLQPQMWELLNFLIEKKKTNIKLQYNTNCSILKYKTQSIFDILKNFQPENIMVQCSIDEVEERAELVRKGTKWNIVKNNVLQILNSNTCITLMGITASCLNVFRLPFILRYMIKHSMISPKHHWTNFYVNPVDEPSYYSLAVIPTDYREKIIKDIEDVCDEYKHFCNFKSKLLTIIHILKTLPYNREAAQRFVDHTAALDAIRKENTYDIIPETRIIRDFLKNS